MPDFVIDLSVLFVAKMGTYIAVSSAVILVYDYFLTLPDEIQYVWPTHWSLGKVLYLSSKYFIIVIFLAELRWIASYNASEAECRASNTILHYSCILAVIAAETLGFKDISTGYRSELYLTDYAKASLSYPGCATVGDDRTASATSYITVLTHETVIFLLMAFDGVRVYSSMPISSMMYTFYEDGFVYYVVLLAISIINMIVSLTQPVSKTVLFFK
ncbi:hypothetical protein EYR36_005725 [Pleurotus pulmonarius]|nr:hypothetical protein EYR36_005725 [Pleurotus pulmonarius]